MVMRIHTHQVKVLAMKKLGKNLAQLMKQKGKIGEKTVLMLGVRMVRWLRPRVWEGVGDAWFKAAWDGGC